MIVSASDGSVGRLTGTTTVPMKWPEQSLKLVSQDLSPGVTMSYKSYGTATQMIVNIPRVADGKDVHAILTMEVTRQRCCRRTKPISTSCPTPRPCRRTSSSTSAPVR